MQRIGFVTFSSFGAMGLAMLSTFEHANLTKGEQFYEVTLLSESGGPVRSSAGFSVITEPFGEDVFDTLIVGASTQWQSQRPVSSISSGAACVLPGASLGHGPGRAAPKASPVKGFARLTFGAFEK